MNVYHKSYQIDEPITVTVTPEKMEITSLPGPDRTITDSDLANRRMVSRCYRNRRIGDFLKELKLVEGRNTGIPTILRSMEQNGSGLPTFETDEDRTYLTVILPIHKDFIVNIQPTQIRATKGKRNRAEIKELIIATLSDRGAISTSQLAKELGYAKVTDALSKAIKELMLEGKIAYSEPDKPTSRNQKLRINRL